MSHRPFEDWLLDDTPRSADEARQLQRHLASCGECRALAQAWAEVETRLQQTQGIGPRPGFAARWRERYQAEQLNRSRRQAWALLAGLCAAGLPLAAVLIVRVLTLLRSPAYLALACMEALAALVARLYWLLSLLRAMREAIQATDLGLLAVGLAAALGFAGSLWVASVYRFAVQGVRR